jgi:hypothetical protein
MNTRPRSTRRSTRRWTRPLALLLLAIVAVLLLAVGVASAGPAPSVEGVWAFGGGQIAIQPLADGTFVGTVVAETKFAECAHPDGQQIWTDMTVQADGSYWGLHKWYFKKSGCTLNPTLGPTAWRAFDEPDGSRYLRVCLSDPGTSQPTIPLSGPETGVTYGCFDSALTAPLPTGGAGGFKISIRPNAEQCVSGRRFEIHIAEPPDDPFKAIRVTLRGRRIATKRRGDYVDATVSLKGLPAGAFAIKVRATTVLGTQLAGSRTYHTCAKKKKHKPAKLKVVKAADAH